MKRIRIVTLIGSMFLFFAISLFADNSKAIMYYKLQLLDSSKEMLLKNLQKSDCDKGEACYYLGKIALKNQLPDSASYYFKKGEELNPDCRLNLIGEGQLMLVKDKKQAKNLFDRATEGKGKNDPLILLAIARAYMESNDEQYLAIIEDLKTEYDKLPDVYILEGDGLLMKNNYGDALSLYEQALYFDPKCEEAYLKYAQVYKNTKPAMSLEMLNKLLAVKPDSELAQREIAEVNFTMGDFGAASDSYKRFLSSEASPSAHDLNRYATILYYNNQLDEALSFINQVLAKNSNDLVMNRLKMYINASKGISEESMKHADAFMKGYKEEDYITLDYIYYGRLLKESKRYEEAMNQFEQVVKSDPDKVEVLRDIAETYESMNDYQKAIEAYQRLMDQKKEKVETSDYLAFGKAYYFEADAIKNSADSIHQKEFLQKADSLFSVVAEKSPNNSLGFFWRARALSLIDYDTTKGLAKPYYEKVLTIIEPEGKDKKKLVECYNYLGYYHYVQNDMEASMNFWNKSLNIDPENEVAKRAIAGIKGEIKGK